jgi:hypothetical protein
MGDTLILILKKHGTWLLTGLSSLKISELAVVSTDKINVVCVTAGKSATMLGPVDTADLS